jgi:hypothetical protein
VPTFLQRVPVFEKIVPRFEKKAPRFLQNEALFCGFLLGPSNL